MLDDDFFILKFLFSSFTSQLLSILDQLEQLIIEDCGADPVDDETLLEEEDTRRDLAFNIVRDVNIDARISFNLKVKMKFTCLYKVSTLSSG